jgi:2-oxoglutarate ferredoxin oxidoreductase subunit gamma
MFLKRILSLTIDRGDAMKDIIFSGIGGQGLLIVSKLLAQAAVEDGKDVLFFPVFGGSIKGGPVHCTTRISEDPIMSSPIVENASAAVMMAEYGFDLFGDKIKPGGLLIMNSSLLQKDPPRDDITVYTIPASTLAEEELGNILSASMVALGAFNKITGLVSQDALAKGMEEILPPYRHKLIPVNQEALKCGAQFAKSMKPVQKASTDIFAD